MTTFEEAIIHFRKGDFEEARETFESILLESPRDAEVLYNLGLCFTDLGQVDKAVTVLNKSIEYNPGHSHSHVALGYAYFKLGDSVNALKYSLHALKLVPGDYTVMLNLAGIYGKMGDAGKAIYYLEKAHNVKADDPSIVYGLAYAYHQAQDCPMALKYYRQVLQMETPPALKELAEDGLLNVARGNKSGGLSLDAVSHMFLAMRLFAYLPEAKIKEISYEIDSKLQSGLDFSNPDTKYTLASLPGSFSGLQLVSYVYVGLKIVAPDQDTGVNFSKEFAMALKMLDDEAVIRA
jgi:tetratricopeptide (TPR) repeat protein